MPLILVRHARAGDRRKWEGDDRERPLDDRGAEQARELVERLAGFRIDEIHTSPAVRCIQTVAPLAEARSLALAVREELSEELQSVAGAALLHALAGRDAVVCGHGGLEHALPEPRKWRKGAAFVLDEGLRIVAEV
jgi:8-oxo-(d)GTP phosphatase